MLKNKFGMFMENRRKAQGLSLRKIAMTLELSPAYVNDIEKGKRNPPGLKILIKIAELLRLSEDELEMAIDLASEDRDEVPMDLQEYIKSNELVIEALRKARKMDEIKGSHIIVEKAWCAFIYELDQ